MKGNLEDYLGDFGDKIIQNYNLIQPSIFEKSNGNISCQEWRDIRAKQRGYKIESQLKCANPDCDNKPELVLTSNCTVCPECGVSSDYNLVDSWVRVPTPYKRLTHFKDWLIKSQAKHTVEFPENFISTIKTTIPYNKLSYYSIRNYLKKRGLFKYYEDIALILFTITGKVYFILTSKEEDLLIRYFILINKVYNNFKFKNRKSIISYSFIIRELITLFFSKSRIAELSLDFFVLPKPEKVLEYNIVFKKISSYYNW